MDLALEGRHLWQFNYNFRHHPNVRFPWPIYPLVSPEARPPPAPPVAPSQVTVAAHLTAGDAGGKPPARPSPFPPFLSPFPQ